LFEEARAERWGLSVSAVFERPGACHSKAHERSGIDRGQREEFLSTLHLEDLALAQACATGCESAWEFFVETYRPYLRSAAAAILRASSASAEARELADSLFAELYGLADGKTASDRCSGYFHGRRFDEDVAARGLLAQRHIDAVRVAKRFASLDEPDGEGKVHEPADKMILPPSDPHRSKYLKLFQTALVAGARKIEMRDRERSNFITWMEKTLAEIGKKLGEHESSVFAQSGPRPARIKRRRRRYSGKTGGRVRA